MQGHETCSTQDASLRATSKAWPVIWSPFVLVSKRVSAMHTATPSHHRPGRAGGGLSAAHLWYMAILALLVPFFVISRYGQRSEEAQELCNCECDAPSRPRDDGCLRVLQSMTSARSDHGSPAYVAPEVPHAIATLRATRQELEYTASIIDVKPSTISPDMWGAFAKVDLPALTFLGTYIGDIFDLDTFDDHVDPSLYYYSFAVHRAARSFPPAVDDVDSWEAAYGFDSYDLLVPRLPLDPRGADFIDGNFNATPFVNEAPPGTPYNVMSVSSYAYDLHGPPTEVDGDRAIVVEFYTCRPVAAGEELFISYGQGYSRDYPVNSDLGECALDKELYISAKGGPACRVLASAS